MKRLQKVLFCSIFLMSTIICTAQEITIQRVYSVDYIIGGCTLGYLSVDGEVICYTLELPWRDNQSNISSIPAGRYDAIVRTDGNKGWRLELLYVPSRYNIQIHIGNYTSDITGCTLVGMDASVDYCEVYYSRSALNVLQHKLEPLIGRRVTVTYYD